LPAGDDPEVAVTFAAVKSWRAAALVFGSSAAILMLEILAGRLMAPYVGVSLETFTGIIGTVLAGIAIGAAMGGVLADRLDPRPFIGPALLVGGALTWASLPILRVLGPNVGTGPVAIVVLTAAAFLGPATVLSAVTPMVTKLRLHSLEETGSVVGRLSAAGTFGALAGTYLTGFVLVAALPSRPVVILIGALLIVAGTIVSWRLGSLGSPGVVALALVIAGVGAVMLPPPCERETAYFCMRVEPDAERSSGRSLILDQVRHAYADLEDPTHLELRYVRLVESVTETMATGPLDVLHIGGGGFTYPRYLQAVRPGSQQMVLEIDGELVDVARDQLGLNDEAGLDIRVGDARTALADLPTDGFDLIVGDAFASTSVPWHLTTVEVMAQLHRMLRPGGVYVMNVIDGGESRYARAQLATLAEEFDHVEAIVPPDGIPGDSRVNQILVASQAPLATIRPAAADGVVLNEQKVRDYVDGADPLTDDHAPVDQLLLG